LFGQGSGAFKWKRWGSQAADLSAGSVAKYASSGVWSARLEWGRRWLMGWTPPPVTASARFRGRVRELIEDASNELPGSFRLLIERLLDHLKELDTQVGELEAQIKASHRNSEASRKLEKIPGIGPITASALVATVGDAKNSKNGRQLAAWMGLVPAQSSSGGKTTLGISVATPI